MTCWWLAIKSNQRRNHLKHLELLLNKLHKHQMKLNPLKCVFSITSSKFLGFIVLMGEMKLVSQKLRRLSSSSPHETCRNLKDYKAILLIFVGSSQICLIVNLSPGLVKKCDVWRYQEALKNIKNILSHCLSLPTASNENLGFIYYQCKSLPWCTISPSQCWRKVKCLALPKSNTCRPGKRILLYW